MFNTSASTAKSHHTFAAFKKSTARYSTNIRDSFKRYFDNREMSLQEWERLELRDAPPDRDQSKIYNRGRNV